MEYGESLAYLYGLQRFGIKLGLENIRALLERFGHPERAFPVIHVAGTNGKGSVSACLAEILHRAGYRVGHYSSPHLHSFTERIQINGAPISEADVVALTKEIKTRGEDIPTTFFEFTTAMALLYFQRRGVDFAVLEVGMGGRLDATNAVVPRLCVITPICRDHAEHLGSDLTAIAGEKAGIIKDRIAVVIGQQDPQALKVLQEQAQRSQAPVVLLGRDFAPNPAAMGFAYQGLDLALEGLRPGLEGRHQHDNLSVALAAAELLRRQGTIIPDAALREGVEQVRWPGRLEWWGDQRTILLDGAHNEGGARVLADYLAGLDLAGIRWVVGLKGDKRIEEIFVPLLPYVTAIYCTVPPVDVATAPELLVAAGQAAGLPATAYGTPASALQAALADRQQKEIVLIAGSLFLVAAAREFLNAESGLPN